jgi:RNA polymerase sigma-70 factor, ECF subfamily
MGGEVRKDFVANLSRVQPALRGFALALTGSFADAEDLIQETNLVLWSKAAEFDSSKPLIGWALGIARNIAKNSQRKWKGLALCADNQMLERLSERFSVLSNEIDARQEHLRECVEKLPARQKQILLSRYEEDLSTRDLATRFETTEGYIHLLLTRVRAALHECINRRMARDEGSAHA